MTEPLAVRRFAMADQQAFAALSGDVNPMHVDPLAARRTQAGVCVVHGINAMLWAIDAALAARPDTEFAGLSAQFERFVAIDETVELRVAETAAGLRLDIGREDVRMLRVTLRRQPARAALAPRPDGAGAAVSAIPARPVELDYADAAHLAGRLAPATEGALPYPHVVTRLGEARVRGIVALSTLVGMVAPGLHSIFSALDLRLDEAGDPALTYRVAETHDAFRLVALAVGGPGFAGRVQTFVRQPPVRQPAMAALAGIVPPDAYAGTSALIVGGSRGLGALTARLLAAGGARTAISYSVGRDDAEAVAADIRSAGGTCETLRYDALAPAGPQVAALAAPVDQLYYFATGKIFLQKSDAYAPAVHEGFHRIYVDGFADLCRTLAAAAPIAAFYPSSVAVADRPRGTTEYAMAKAAAEILCEDLDRFTPSLRVVMRRLPRLLTDQTTTVTPIPTPPATDVMREVVAAMMAGR